MKPIMFTLLSLGDTSHGRIVSHLPHVRSGVMEAHENFFQKLFTEKKYSSFHGLIVISSSTRIE